MAFCAVAMGVGVVCLTVEQVGQPVEAVAQSRLESRTSVPALSEAGDVSSLLDLNTASRGELIALPGVGGAISQRIIDYRDIMEGFIDARELIRISGIGEKRLAALLPLVYAEAPTD